MPRCPVRRWQDREAVDDETGGWDAGEGAWASIGWRSPEVKVVDEH